MIFTPLSLGSDGHIQAVTAGTITSINAGIAYVGRQPRVVTAADDASDNLIAGIRVRADGSVRITDATAGAPAGSFLNAGLLVTASGRLCVAIADVGADVVRCHGIACKNDGRAYMSTVTEPAYSALPVITGDTAGEESSVSDGTWSGSPSFTYRWYLDGVLIAGETAATIDTDEAWATHTLSAVVTAQNDGGSASATAAGVVLVEASGYVGPLDLVPGAAWGCSLRSLSAAFSTAVIRVKQQDLPEDSQDFSPALNNAVDTAAVQTFVNLGADDVGIGTIFYDQSGNSNNSVGIGPIWIQDGGGSLPAFNCNVNNRFQTSNITFVAGARSFSFVVNYVQNSNGNIFIETGGGGAGTLYIQAYRANPNDLSFEVDDGIGNSVIWIAPISLSTGRHLIEIRVTALGAVTMFVDGSNINAVITAGSAFALPGYTGYLNLPAGGTDLMPYYEIIIWPLATAQAAQANIAAYYGITL